MTKNDTNTINLQITDKRAHIFFQWHPLNVFENLILILFTAVAIILPGAWNIKKTHTGTNGLEINIEKFLPQFLFPADNDSPAIPRWLLNTCISLGGLMALHMFFGKNIAYLLVCAALVYAILFVTSWKFQKGAGVMVAIFIFLFIVIW